MIGALVLLAAPALADVCQFDAANPFTPASLATALADPACEVVEVPPGTHDLGDWGFPFITHPLILRGNGAALVINLAQEGGVAPPSRQYRFLRTNADLAVEDLELRNFASGIKADPEDTTVIDLVLENATFVNMDRGVFSDGPDPVIVNDPTTGRNTGLARLEILRSTFRDVDTPIDLNLATMQDVRIDDNRFTGVAGVAMVLGNAMYDPIEKRAKIFVRGNIIEHVNGAPEQAVAPFRAGIFLHGNHCFVRDNFVRDVPPPANGWSAGIYTKCKYAKVAANTVVDAGGAFASQNGAITIKGKERDEIDGAFGFGALVADNHIVFRDTSPSHRIGVKIHAGYTYVTDNVIENATVDAQDVGVDEVTIDRGTTSDPEVTDDDGIVTWFALLP